MSKFTSSALVIFGMSLLAVWADAPAQAQSLEESPVVVIPESTALTVVFPHQDVIEMMEDSSKDATLPLAQPLLDAAGNVIVPSGADVQVHYEATEDGISMTAEAINMGGQFVPLETSTVDLGGIAFNNDARYRQGMVAHSYLPTVGAGIGRLIFDDEGMVGPIIGTIAGTVAQQIFDSSSPEVAVVAQVLPGMRQTLQLTHPLAVTPTEDGGVRWSQLTPVNEEESVVNAAG